jgi:hypothetical protein
VALEGSCACILPHMTGAQNTNLKSDVKDVTSIFDHYRMSARAIWNTAWPDQDFRNWDSIDHFHEIEKLLFQELVLAKVDKRMTVTAAFQEYHLLLLCSSVAYAWNAKGCRRFTQNLTVASHIADPG